MKMKRIEDDDFAKKKLHERKLATQRILATKKEIARMHELDRLDKEEMERKKELARKDQEVDERMKLLSIDTEKKLKQEVNQAAFLYFTFVLPNFGHKKYLYFVILH